MKGMFTIEHLPDGKLVYVTEMSTWAGNGKPDPLTGRPCWGIVLERRWTDCRNEDITHFVGVAPSGAHLHIFND